MKNFPLIDLSQSLSQRIATILENEILEGEFSPGERIYEVKISKRLKVSRSPVREAFYILEKKGLVSILPRRGVFVSDITTSGINNILDLRRALDGLAARLAAMRISEKQLEKLKAITKRQELNNNSKKIKKLEQIGHQFHDAVYKSTDNPKLISMWQDLYVEGTLFRIADISVPGSIEQSHNEHRKIFEAIRDRDEKLAQKLSENHIEHVRRRLLQTIKLKKR